MSPGSEKRTEKSKVKLGFDIFRRLEDGSPLWVAQASSIAEARSRLQALQQGAPDNYFIRDAETGQSIETDGCEKYRADL
jgi:hypothetical protein